MHMAVYLKNFGSTLATDTMNQKDELERVAFLDRLAQVINLFIQATLSQNVAEKYKKQFPIIITRQLNVLYTLTKKEEEHFNTFLGNMIKQIMAAMTQTQDKETLIGAILLTEAVFAVLKPKNFQQAFELLMTAMQGVAELQIANFKADMLTVQSQMPFDQILSADNPIAKRLIGYLDVLNSWVCMFERILEKFERKACSFFAFFTRSEALSATMVALIGLTANQHVNQVHS